MYIVTFRIANTTINGKSYQDRYQALDKQLKARAKVDGLWFDTTSFFVVGSNENTYQFGARLIQGLDQKQDMLFAFDPEDMSAVYFGNIAAEDVLLDFFPKAKKLG